MFYRQKDRLRRKWFDYRVRGLLDTAPIRCVDSGPALLSQLQHKDVRMYLAAAKSFARQLAPAEIHIVDDGSLTPDDHALLTRHFPDIRFHALADCRDPELPQGGCWERLIAIARLSIDRYVIQLDSDTLTLAAIDEVTTAARESHSFSIGTWDRQTLEPAAERASTAQSRLGMGHPHVQLLAEAHFDRLQHAEPLRYVRGCAGFSGFSASADKLDLMRSLSSQMQALIRERWREWGSEQVMSNLIVANQPGAIVLPHPAYADCEKMQPDITRFVHFIGTCRFQRGVYARQVTRVLPDLVTRPA
jgi:hypothetical protein